MSETHAAEDEVIRLLTKERDALKAERDAALAELARWKSLSMGLTVKVALHQLRQGPIDSQPHQSDLFIYNKLTGQIRERAERGNLAFNSDGHVFMTSQRDGTALLVKAEQLH